MPAKTQPFKSFKGLQNTLPPHRLGLGWLAVADNVDVHSTGMVERRDGYQLAHAIPQLRFAFTLSDYSAGVMVADGGLHYVRDVGGAVDATRLTTLSFPESPMHCCEVNGEIYYSNGFDNGIVGANGALRAWEWVEPVPPALSASTGPLPAGLYRVRLTYVLPDGRETGASDEAYIQLPANSMLVVSGIVHQAGYRTRVYVCPADADVFMLAADGVTGAAISWAGPIDGLGVELLTADKCPLPMGAEALAFWRGRVYVADYLESDDQSVIWFSSPFAFHLFDLGQDFFMVKGKVTMLADAGEALLVGSSRQVLAYTGDALSELAPYGVVQGQCWAKDQDTGQVVFWSKRGFCQAMPFQNLTQSNLSVPHGTQAACALVQRDGEKKFIASLVKGGSAFNPRSSP